LLSVIVLSVVILNALIKTFMMLRVFMLICVILKNVIQHCVTMQNYSEFVCVFLHIFIMQTVAFLNVVLNSSYAERHFY